MFVKRALPGFPALRADHMAAAVCLKHALDDLLLGNVDGRELLAEMFGHELADLRE